jgi:hypothetical protein
LGEKKVSHGLRSSQARTPTRLHLQPGTYGKNSHRARATVGGLSGLAGVLALFAGVALTSISWLAGRAPAGVWLQRAGVALLLVAVPLLAFGAHCFDRADREAGAATTTTTTRKGRG